MVGSVSHRYLRASCMLIEFVLNIQRSPSMFIVHTHMHFECMDS